VDVGTRIEKLILDPINAMGFDLIRVKLDIGADPVLQIMAERPDGTMSVEECAEISRAVSAILDVEDLIKSEYTLEVSSPGLDRPLTRLADFERYAGFDARLEMREQRADGRKRFRGRLCGVEGDNVALEIDSGREMLAFDDIEKAKLLITDALIEASLAKRKN